jgi:hypothetical protein
VNEGSRQPELVSSRVRGRGVEKPNGFGDYPPACPDPVEYSFLPCRQYSLGNKTVRLVLLFMFIALSPIVSLVAGILILVFPRLLNFIVAIHLIIVGLLGLMHR